MGIFDLFGSSGRLRDKIIFTQKQRILTLEKELTDIKGSLGKKEDEVVEIRTNFEKSKERLVDQIIELSDKFAGINQKMLDIAHENAKMKHLLGHDKKAKKKARKEAKQKK